MVSTSHSVHIKQIYMTPYQKLAALRTQYFGLCLSNQPKLKNTRATKQMAKPNVGTEQKPWLLKELKYIDFL